MIRKRWITPTRVYRLWQRDRQGKAARKGVQILAHEAIADIEAELAEADAELSAARMGELGESGGDPGNVGELREQVGSVTIGQGQGQQLFTDGNGSGIAPRQRRASRTGHLLAYRQVRGRV